MLKQESLLVGLCRYAIALTGMSLAVLIGEGWSGPLSVMLTLALPPEIKSFAISLLFALAQLIGPAGSVLFGIYLTVGHLSTALGLPANKDSPLIVRNVAVESCVYCHAAAQ